MAPADVWILQAAHFWNNSASKPLIILIGKRICISVHLHNMGAIDMTALKKSSLIAALYCVNRPVCLC